MIKQKNKVTEDYSQEYLESKILEYQKALNESQKDLMESIYKKICDIYMPEKYVHIWQRQYLYLYDSAEDFTQDYMRVFVQAIRKWKPKEERGKSRYGGAGTFKNYFWGSLSHNYINLVKSIEGAAKRNYTSRCPECGDWVNPMSTHIIKNHSDLLWDKLLSEGVDIHNLKMCPFCKNSIYRGKSELAEKELIKRHILSKHLHMLFDIFSEKYPTTHSGSAKHISADIMSDQSDEAFTIYDTTAAPSGLLDKIISSGLSKVQTLIVENVVSKKNINLKYSKSMYKCSEQEFNQALDGLKEKITIMEDIIGKY
jgi:hypothetical protein